MKRVGIIGGTFDPVHRGHLSLAQDALAQAGLDTVLLMPAKRQPFKLEQKVTEAADRIAMLQLATASLDRIGICTLEMKLPGISYTCRTLDVMRSISGERTKFYFITGSDTYCKLEIWKEADRLLTDNAFIVGSRPGYQDAALQQAMARYRTAYGTETIRIDNVRRDVSSTEIRKRIRAGQSAVDLIPEAVERYIYEHGLYQ